MTVTTVFATAPGGNGSVQSSNATYATARTSGSLLAVNNHFIGQVTGVQFVCYESFLIFDTSGVPDTDTVSGVVLSLSKSTDDSTTDFVATAASSSYDGGAVVTTDWVDGSTLSGLTTYATFDTAGWAAGYNAFTSAGAAFNSAINKVGSTPMIVYSDRHSAGTQPTGNERVSAADADAAGTTSDPKLDITHAAGGTLQDIIGGLGIIPFAR